MGGCCDKNMFLYKVPMFLFFTTIGHLLLTNLIIQLQKDFNIGVGFHMSFLMQFYLA